MKNGPAAGRARKGNSNKNHTDFPLTALASPTQVPPHRSGGRASRQKGNRVERALVHALREAGFAAERVPLSGSVGGRYLGDISVPLLGLDRTVEVKARAHGFQQLYAWLEARDILIVRADRREPLVVLPLKLAAEIAAIAENNHRASWQQPQGPRRLAIVPSIQTKQTES
jgi:Holliday junction resolvase